MKTKITYVGHATVLIETREERILTDPLLRGRTGFLWRYKSRINEQDLRSIDTVVISHAHRDHLDIPSLRKLDSSVRLIVPRGMKRSVRSKGLLGMRIEEVGADDVIDAGLVKIRATPANHSNSFKPHKHKADFLGYVIKGDHNIYFAGDTDVFEEMKNLGKVDIAMLPVWGWGPTLGSGHMTPRRAAESLRMLKPSIAIPIHWGTLHPLGIGYLGLGYMKSPPREFKRFASETAHGVDVRILNPGEYTEVT